MYIPGLRRIVVASLVAALGVLLSACENQIVDVHDRTVDATVSSVVRYSPEFINVRLKGDNTVYECKAGKQCLVITNGDTVKVDLHSYTELRPKKGSTEKVPARLDHIVKIVFLDAPSPVPSAPSAVQPS